MIRSFCMAGLVAGLAIVCVNSEAAEPLRGGPGAVDTASLEAMGLGGIRVMTRDDSEQLRGQGAIVFGRSYAFQKGLFGSASSVNGYKASGKSIAFGTNFSTAKTLFGKSSAGGFSVAGGF